MMAKDEIDWATSWHSTSSLSGLTRNPYDLNRDPGGSSSGTGAAIAADLATLGIGEDTGGSIRVPSSFCGLVGIRCTPGLISRSGLSPLLVPQDTPGPMCRTVRDTALMLDILAGFDERDPYTAAAFIAGKPTGGSYAANLSVEKIKSARIGVLSETFGSDSDPDCRSVNMVMKNTLQKLQENGTTLINVEIPNLKHYLQTTFMYPQRSRSDLDAFFSRHPYLKTNTTEIYEKKQYHPALDLFEDIATGPGDPQKDAGFTDRLFARDELQRLIITVMAKNALDALAFPDVQVPAPSLDDVLAQRWSGATFPTNTLIASQSLLPAISIPAGLTEGDSGLPVGLELLGLPYREQLLLELAYGVEKVTMARKPPTL
jgi:amidase